MSSVGEVFNLDRGGPAIGVGNPSYKADAGSPLFAECLHIRNGIKGTFMAEKGKYIYGIIDSCNELLFSDIDFPASNEGSPRIKNNGGKVYSISYKDISAVVSDSEIVDYNDLLKIEVARKLLRHQQVIEKVMENHTIIPMLLGTFAEDADEVNNILSRWYELMKDVFNRITGKIEIDVVATWSDFNLILQEMGEKKEIKDLKAEIMTNPAGVSLDDRMKVGLMVKKALDKTKVEYALQIQDKLRKVSRAVKNHDLMDDEMITNTAFLVDRARQEEFDGELEKLDAGFDEKLNFRCIGPLPPYSFYTLETQKMRFKEVDLARKLFGLNDTSTVDEIKKAYQRIAFSSHPDTNPKLSGAEEVFNNLNKAYRLLLDYCQASKQTGAGGRCSFNQEKFKENAILVKVKSESD